MGIRKPSKRVKDSSRPASDEIPVGLTELRGSTEQAEPNTDVIVLLIHEITDSRNTAWSPAASDESVPLPDLFRAYLPHSKILSYGYNVSSMKELPHLLDSDTLKSHAEGLLEALAAHAGEYPRDLAAHNVGSLNREKISNDYNCPLIIVAHGYGGLIYEKALSLSYAQNSDHTYLTERHQLAYLLNTPHLRPGLGEWAIMCARRGGIPCAKTARAQFWSDKIRASAATIADMQSELRHILTHNASFVQAVGCFASSPDPRNKLVLSPEWAVMPGFVPIKMHTHHFSMSAIQIKDEAWRRIADTFTSWTSRQRLNISIDRQSPMLPPIKRELPHPIFNSFSSGGHEHMEVQPALLSRVPPYISGDVKGKGAQLPDVPQMGYSVADDQASREYWEMRKHADQDENRNRRATRLKYAFQEGIRKPVSAFSSVVVPEKRRRKNERVNLGLVG